MTPSPAGLRARPKQTLTTRAHCRRMTRGKSAKLVNGGSHERASGGEAVAIAASCIFGTREAEPVLVTDLNQQGCRLHTAAVGGVSKAQPLVLHLPGCAPIEGKLAWSKGGALGVSFSEPLSGTVLETLCAQQSAANVVPFRS